MRYLSVEGMMAGISDERSDFGDLGAIPSGLSASSISTSSSFRADGRTPKKKCPKRSSLDEEDFINLLHGSDPVKMELNRLQNELRDKDRELLEAQSEVKAQRLAERAKEKALAEVTEELDRMVEKFQASEAALENKNLEIKRSCEEKKAAIAAQFAAEATLRRVHAAQKDEDIPSLEAILAPLDSEIKLLRQETSFLQEDKRALERLTKSKEAALLEAEKEIHFAKVKASIVDDLQNRNQELMKQVEISQEEYRILDKMHRQKIAEVEKLGQTVRELEEAILSGAAAANAVRDYQRQVNELKGEKKTLERTLSRAKATENRLAVAVANEWKDSGDKFMPVKQWLEERRGLMREMQQIRDKLAVAERAARTEAQLKEKFQLRLKVVEEGLKSLPNCRPSTATVDLRGSNTNGHHRRQSLGGSVSTVGRTPASPGRSLTFPRPLTRMLKHAKALSKASDTGKSLPEDQCGKEPLSKGESLSQGERAEPSSTDGTTTPAADSTEKLRHENEQSAGERVMTSEAEEDVVSGVFYDVLQKEVISLRKLCQEKDEMLKDKEKATEMLARKIETLTKAMEVEGKKMRRERAAMEKEVASMRTGSRGHELLGKASKRQGGPSKELGSSTPVSNVRYFEYK